MGKSALDTPSPLKRRPTCVDSAMRAISVLVASSLLLPPGHALSLPATVNAWAHEIPMVNSMHAAHAAPPSLPPTASSRTQRHRLDEDENDCGTFGRCDDLRDGAILFIILVIVVPCAILACVIGLLVWACMCCCCRPGSHSRDCHSSSSRA